MPRRQTPSPLPFPEGGSPAADAEELLQRKRARDRKAQQAMRSRAKVTVQTLTDQVAALSLALHRQSQYVSQLESQNARLQVQKAALQLSLLRYEPQGAAADDDVRESAIAELEAGKGPPPPWRSLPLNTPASSPADGILQGLVQLCRGRVRAGTLDMDATLVSWPLARNTGVLLGEAARGSDDEVSSVVADIVCAYQEIADLPRRIAVFYIISLLTKWQIAMNEARWHMLPTWLRPGPAQLSTVHAAWIDRVPWPSAREYLVQHPEITLDVFAAQYSSSFKLNWPYAHSSVLMSGNETAPLNPVFEEHVRKLSNWTIHGSFRTQLPALTLLIDNDAQRALLDTGSTP